LPASITAGKLLFSIGFLSVPRQPVRVSHFASADYGEECEQSYSSLRRVSLPGADVTIPEMGMTQRTAHDGTALH
jgi:hypothetical protein